eukprot:6491822-Amphidinium_carterae.2
MVQMTTEQIRQMAEQGECQAEQTLRQTRLIRQQVERQTQRVQAANAARAYVAPLPPQHHQLRETLTRTEEEILSRQAPLQEGQDGSPEEAVLPHEEELRSTRRSTSTTSTTTFNRRRSHSGKFNQRHKQQYRRQRLEGSQNKDVQLLARLHHKNYMKECTSHKLRQMFTTNEQLSQQLISNGWARFGSSTVIKRVLGSSKENGSNKSNSKQHPTDTTMESVLTETLGIHYRRLN